VAGASHQGAGFNFLQRRVKRSGTDEHRGVEARVVGSGKHFESEQVIIAAVGRIRPLQQVRGIILAVLGADMVAGADVAALVFSGDNAVAAHVARGSVAYRNTASLGYGVDQARRVAAN
jgi:hypothetical protein